MLIRLFVLSLECVAFYMILPFILTRICGIGVYKTGKSPTKIAFTFDDGPDPRYTPELLDVLNEHGVKATFFVLGSKAEKYPELIRRIHQEGHQIGIHNYVHKANWIMSPGQIRRWQVERSADIVEQITGDRPVYYRPPWGLLNLGDFLFLRRSYRIVLWSVMAGDWKKSTSPNKLNHVLLNKISPGTIIVLHDSGDTFGADEHAPARMIQGLRKGLKEIRMKGYECVRIDELLVQAEKHTMEQPPNCSQSGTPSH